MTAVKRLTILALLLLNGCRQQASPEADSRPDSNTDKSVSPTKASRSWKGIFSASSARKTLELSPDSKVLIYGPENHPSTMLSEGALHIRGFTNSVVVPVNDIDQFHNLGMTDALKAAGIVDKQGQLEFPFYSIDGELYGKNEFVEYVTGLPLNNVREKDSPYIIVYGPPDCPYTKKGAAELDSNGFPYEYRNVNDRRYRGRFDALVDAYAVKYIEWPMVEINGRLFSKPALDIVRSEYR